MFRVFLISYFSICILACNSDSANTVSLEVEYLNTWDEEFGATFSKVDPLISRKKAKLIAKTTGMPEWEGVKSVYIILDHLQFYRQSYKHGLVDSLENQFYQEDAESLLHHRSLTDAYIRSFVRLAYAPREDGFIFKIDTNNDGDLSDEVEYQSKQLSKNLDDLLSESISIEYDQFVNGKVKSREIPIIINHFDDELMYSIPQTGKAHIDGYDIYFSAYSVPSYNWGLHAYAKQVQNNQRSQMTYVNETLTLGTNKYKLIGFNARNETLVLEKAPEMAVQDLAVDARGYDIISKDTISLHQYRGNYLILDFWGTWCKPCLKELPMLVKKNSQLPDSVVLVGIPTNSQIEVVEKLISDFDIQFPQIITADGDEIAELFNVHMFPTKILISPQGEIISRFHSLEELNHMLVDK